MTRYHSIHPAGEDPVSHQGTTGGVGTLGTASFPGSFPGLGGVRKIDKMPKRSFAKFSIFDVQSVENCSSNLHTHKMPLNHLQTAILKV